VERVAKKPIPGEADNTFSLTVPFEASESQSERVEVDIEVGPIDGWEARRCALSETRNGNFSNTSDLTKEN
jgi:hypothetical protein